MGVQGSRACSAFILMIVYNFRRSEEHVQGSRACIVFTRRCKICGGQKRAYRDLVGVLVLSRLLRNGSACSCRLAKSGRATCCSGQPRATLVSVMIFLAVVREVWKSDI